MKGVILQQTDARLVDVSHQFPRQDVRAAAFWLREVLPWFPPAVHLAVVDPGVGTDRAALVVRAADHVFVAPDNGLVIPAARRISAAADLSVFEIEIDDPDSATFHGRDVFAPAAARVHEAGVDAIGSLDGVSPVEEFVDLRFPAPDLQGERAHGEVLVVDDFGNVVTNLPGSLLADRWGERARVNGESVAVARSYAGVPPGERFATVGSHGAVELAVNRGRGSDAFGLTLGDAVELD